MSFFKIHSTVKTVDWERNLFHCYHKNLAFMIDKAPSLGYSPITNCRRNLAKFWLLMCLVRGTIILGVMM